MQDKIEQIVADAQRIVVIQADNPDADSLGSALALEQILGELGKDVALYCGVTMPEYLRYMQGWDRVVDAMPSSFDATIIVDASTYTLLEKLEQSGELNWIKAKPCVVIDHHATVERPLDFATASIIDGEAASAGQLIFDLALALNWPLDTISGAHIMSSILGDTQGLTNELTSAHTYRTMAELTELGVSRSELEEARREYGKMPEKIYRYKGDLIARTEILCDGAVALLRIPQAEINEYSPLYNPAPLIQSDMLQTRGVALAIVIKTYDDGRITGALRANTGFPIAGKLAESLGGGGHNYAAGFKDTSGKSYEDIKKLCIEKASALLEGSES